METLKVVGQVAGIGGVAVGVMLVLFRDFIRKQIFPKLRPAESYKLLRLFLILVWSIAVLGIGAWLLSDWLTKHPHTTASASPAPSLPPPVATPSIPAVDKPIAGGKEVEVFVTGARVVRAELRAVNWVFVDIEAEVEKRGAGRLNGCHFTLVANAGRVKYANVLFQPSNTEFFDIEENDRRKLMQPFFSLRTSADYEAGPLRLRVYCQSAFSPLAAVEKVPLVHAVPSPSGRPVVPPPLK